MEVLWGLICAMLCLLPGWGVGMSALVSNLVPGSGLYAIAGGLIINSVLEARSGAGSGNIYLGVFNYRLGVDEQKFGEALINWKTIVWVVGIIVGLLLPPLLGGSGLFATALGFLIVVSNSGKDGWWKAIVWLCGVTVLMSVCTIANLSSPVLVIGLILFVIPAVGTVPSGVAVVLDGYYSPNWLSLIGASLLSILTPGVSPQAMTTIVERRSGIFTAYLTTAVVETFIEAIAVGQLVIGGGVGKALVTAYAIVPSVWAAALSVGVVIICRQLALAVNARWSGGIAIEGQLRFWASCVGVVAVVILAGIWALALIPLGLIINHCFGRTLEPGIKGLTFISLLI